MTSDFRNTEFRNLLTPTASTIHPGNITRPGETTFNIQEDHYNISALHRDSKPATIRENDFASRIQSLMSGEVALGNLDHGTPPSSLVMSSPGLVPNGSVSPGGIQVEAQHDQNSRAPSRYEAQKRRDWNTFGQYLRNHRPPLALARCTGVHVLEFVRYLDQFGKTKVHNPSCPFFGLPHPPHPCPCPLRQAWGSLDALIGRLRAAFEENGGKPESNPFGARQVRLYLREVREMQAKARGIAYEKKKRKRMPPASDGGASGVNGVNGLSISNGVGGMSNGNVLAPQLATQQ
ncbi:hypothetical protein KC19_12G054900 [Ceratodon purpureus]|uniref:ALOG domain-containing protein n=1 Tax=Ceratodon purpureus TaxID=3225 RepID=A0A8T0G7I8_CERPU|nr:hypothetical protein KC19_12G054900 [Ceratodon purpureus]